MCCSVCNFLQYIKGYKKKKTYYVKNRRKIRQENADGRVCFLPLYPALSVLSITSKHSEDYNQIGPQDCLHIMLTFGCHVPHLPAAVFTKCIIVDCIRLFVGNKKKKVLSRIIAWIFGIRISLMSLCGLQTFRFDSSGIQGMKNEAVSSQCASSNCEYPDIVYFHERLTSTKAVQLQGIQWK